MLSAYTQGISKFPLFPLPAPSPFPPSADEASRASLSPGRSRFHFRNAAIQTRDGGSSPGLGKMCPALGDTCWIIVSSGWSCVPVLTKQMSPKVPGKVASLINGKFLHSTWNTVDKDVMF